MNISKAIMTLKENGFKITDKREEMLEIFSRENRYLSAKEVLERLISNYPGFSFDTIYRNLTIFEDLNIIEVTEIAGEKRFRFNCGLEHHHHFICLSCGKTKEIHGCPVDKIHDELQGYELSSHRYEIYGKCPSCVS